MSQVGFVPHHLRGASVPQTVGRHRLPQSGFLRTPPDGLGDHRPGHWASPQGKEKPRAIRVSHHVGPDRLDIVLHVAASDLSQGYHPVFSALPQIDPDKTFHRVHVFHLQGPKLGIPQARRVEDFQHGPVTVSHKGMGIRCPQELRHFLAGQDGSGEPLGCLGVGHVPARVLRQDPSRDIPYAKTPKRLPRSILTRKEMSKLLMAPDTHSLMGYRDRAMLEVFYSTGLRNSELGALKVEDVDTEEGFVRVNLGKGGKDRVVPLGKIACRYVENYIHSIRPHLVRGGDNRCLFLSLQGHQMARAVIASIVRRYARKAKLGKTVTPHSLRHTCATQMMRNKANLRHIQELLGHACLTTTQVYTSVTIADLKEAHQKYHPRERERGIYEKVERSKGSGPVLDQGA